MQRVKVNTVAICSLRLYTSYSYLQFEVVYKLQPAYKNLTGQWAGEMRASKILKHFDKIHTPLC